MKSVYAAWMGQPVVMQLSSDDLRVPLRGTVVGETDNVVRFATRRYCDNPLIVQGPGAGPEVTAGGVFSDLLRLSAYLGAHI